MPRGGNHPKHPKCPRCGKAMYKTMQKGGTSKKEDPFCYCRNESCELYGIVQEEKPKEGATEVDSEMVSGELVLVSVEESLLSCRHDDSFPWE